MKHLADYAKVYRSISSVDHMHEVQSSVDEAVTLFTGKCYSISKSVNIYTLVLDMTQ